jgi:ubiquinone/menaquinone biosynthesis C-methylase UbiE
MLKFQTGETLLEVAIGPGRHFIRLAQKIDLKMSVGMDLSARMLKLAYRRLKRSRRINIHLCRGDAIALPFRDRGFDKILSCYMLDLLDERDLPVVLAEFRRVLNVTGRLVVINMAKQSPTFNRLWMSVYRRNPLLVGGCHPIGAAARIEKCGWHVLQHEEIRQSGFRTELVSAKPS